MKDEVKRILKLVQEGKLSAEDAAELIEAFEGAPPEEEPVAAGSAPPPPPPGATGAEYAGSGSKEPPKDPFKSLVEAMEKLGKDASNVNWQEVAKQARESAYKAAETIRGGFEQVKKGKGFGFFGSCETREVTLPLSVPEGKTLRIENPCGDIKVTGGREQGEVMADAKFRGVGEDLKARAAEYTLVIEESESAVVIRQPDVTGLSVDLDIQLLGKANVEIRSESGDIEVTDTRGSCRITTKSGDVELRGLDGQVEISAQSGDMTVEDTTASSVTIENKSGDITLRRVTGSANIRTTSGDVSIRDCELKTLAADGVSGDVDVDLRTPISGAITLRSVSGDVSIAIPDGSDCRVALKALRGQVSCGIPLSDEARSEGQVNGHLGDGTGTLDASSVTGDIRLQMHVSF